MDIYSLQTSIAAVLQYLDRVDPRAAGAARTRYGCLTPWQSEPAHYGRQALLGGESCEAEVQAQLVELLERRLEYAARDGEPFFSAAQNARIVRAAEQYYRVMYAGCARILEPARPPHVRNAAKADAASRSASQGHRVGAQFAYRQCGGDFDGLGRRIQYRRTVPHRLWRADGGHRLRHRPRHRRRRIGLGFAYGGERRAPGARGQLSNISSAAQATRAR